MWSKAFHGQETMKEQDELQIAASLRSYFVRKQSRRRELRFSTHDCVGLCPSTASRRRRPTPTGDRRSPPVRGVLRKTPARSRINCRLPRRCAPRKDGRAWQHTIVPGSDRAQPLAAGVHHQPEPFGHLPCAACPHAL